MMECRKLNGRAIALQKPLKQAIGEGCRKVRVRRCDRKYNSHLNRMLYYHS
ncbi:MAG: hypothetical protein U7126_26365 [Microcoleus sp.]